MHLNAFCASVVLDKSLELFSRESVSVDGVDDPPKSSIIQYVAYLWSFCGFGTQLLSSLDHHEGPFTPYIHLEVE